MAWRGSAGTESGWQFAAPMARREASEPSPAITSRRKPQAVADLVNCEVIHGFFDVVYRRPVLGVTIIILQLLKPDGLSKTYITQQTAL
jgi:hypothetical protein